MNDEDANHVADSSASASVIKRRVGVLRGCYAKPSATSIREMFAGRDTPYPRLSNGSTTIGGYSQAYSVFVGKEHLQPLMSSSASSLAGAASYNDRRLGEQVVADETTDIVELIRRHAGVVSAIATPGASERRDGYVCSRVRSVMLNPESSGALVGIVRLPPRGFAVPCDCRLPPQAAAWFGKVQSDAAALYGDAMIEQDLAKRRFPPHPSPSLSIDGESAPLPIELISVEDCSSPFLLKAYLIPTSSTPSSSGTIATAVALMDDESTPATTVDPAAMIMPSTPTPSQPTPPASAIEPVDSQREDDVRHALLEMSEALAAASLPVTEDGDVDEDDTNPDIPQAPPIAASDDSVSGLTRHKRKRPMKRRRKLSD